MSERESYWVVTSGDSGGQCWCAANALCRHGMSWLGEEDPCRHDVSDPAVFRSAAEAMRWALDGLYGREPLRLLRHRPDPGCGLRTFEIVAVRDHGEVRDDHDGPSPDVRWKVERLYLQQPPRK